MSAEPLTASAASITPDTGAVDAENPWPGLAAFREADQEFFYGREAETEELFRLVLRDRLTVLFGLSGLGKTSLLQAGLFPRLRQENVLPVRIRLDFSEHHLPLIDQVKAAIVREAAAAGVEAPAPRSSETLWELFHRQGAEFWNARNRLVTPLLVFDQFEEIFTLGREDAETGALLNEIAALSEGAPPESVRTRLDDDPAEARAFSFNRHPYKLLLSLREDFLPDLDGLRDRMRSVGSNRLRLQRMSGANALEVITRAGARLIAPDAAERVVRFVAGRPEEDQAPLASFDVEPALLSVVCRQLNNKRRSQEAPQITTGLLQGNREEILSDFYERSLADLDPGVRIFIEESLITVSGFRDSVALENALGRPGVTQEAIDELTDRRLLRIEDRGGVERLELSHDVLTKVIRASRDSRREREAQERERKTRRQLARQRQVMALLALLLAVVVVLGLWGLAGQRQARSARSVSDVQAAVSLRDSRPSSALAYLAHAARTDPKHSMALSWLADLLLYRTWPLPLGEIRVDAGITFAELSPDGRLLLTGAPNGQAVLWDLRTGRRINLSPVHPEALLFGRFSPDGRRVLTISGQTIRIWETGTGKRIAELREDIPVFLAAFSPDGASLAVASQGQVVFRAVGSGRPQPPPVVTGSYVFSTWLSPDGRLLATRELLEGSFFILVRELPEGRLLGGPLQCSNASCSVAFSPDSRFLTFTSYNNVQIWELADRAALRFVSEFYHPEGEVSSARFSPDGGRVVTASDDRSARIWEASSGRSLSEPLEHSDIVMSAAFQPDGRVVTVSMDGAVRLWNVQTGITRAGALELPEPALRVAFGAGGRAATFGSGSAIRLWDLATSRATGVFNPPPPGSGFLETRFSDDGRYLMALSFGQEIPSAWLLHGETGRPILGPLLKSLFVLVSSDGKKIATLFRDDVSVRDLSTGRVLTSLSYPQLSGVEFSPDGQRLVMASRNGTARIWDLHFGQQLGELLRHQGAIISVLFSPDGHRIATMSTDRTARLWDGSSGAPQSAPLPIEDRNNFFQFSPDGRLLLIVTRNRISIRDGRDGKHLGGFLVPGQYVSCLSFTPDGEGVATCSNQGTVQIWQTRTGKPLGSPFSLGAPVLNARFSPDGRILYIATPAQIQAWDVPDGSPGDAETLARLAEAVGGFRINDEGTLVPVDDPFAELQKLRNPGGTSSLVRWFFADRATRTISPLSKVTVPEYIRSRLAKGTAEARAEALKAYPDHPIVLEELPHSTFSPPPIPE
jgi:WD40 repeat protein